MYTKLANVRILVALLKQHGVRHIVLSAGTRQVPLARCVESDPFFKTYSVVDERSAAYFAIGLMKGTREPVGISCTSSTATCNYLPAVAEARYLGLPLIVMTGDRDIRFLDQLEDQMIPQPGMYTHFCKKVVDLAPIANPPAPDDEWVCGRLVNEALLSAVRDTPGPVQINYRVVAPITDIADASVESLPDVQMIRRIGLSDDENAWRNCADELRKKRRVLVLAGQMHDRDPELGKAIDTFASCFNCVIAVENLSNATASASLHTFLAVQALPPGPFKDRLPDLVISFGGNILSAWKAKLRVNAKAFDHWLVSPDGEVKDGFKSLTHIFECRPIGFFRRMAEFAGNAKNNGEYLDLWKETVSKVSIADIPYSNAYAITETVKRLPKDSILHTGILHSTRMMEFQPVPDGVRVHSNIGTHGIDGTMSAFFGQSVAEPSVPCYLILGDLSFFYDMNSIRIRHLGRNIHVLLVNNGGGAEFHFTMGCERIPNIEQSISAGHQASAKDWVLSQGFKYLSATDKASFDLALPEFLKENQDLPVLFEVFTEKQSDGEAVRTIFADIRQTFASEIPVKDHVVATLSGKAPKLAEAAANLKNKFLSAFHR